MSDHESTGSESSVESLSTQLGAGLSALSISEKATKSLAEMAAKLEVAQREKAAAEEKTREAEAKATAAANRSKAESETARVALLSS
jgi:hypothetical protein